MFRALVLSLMLLPAVAAQEADDSCSQEAPCEWIVEVDEDGFEPNEGFETVYNGTVGDWYRLSILNADTKDHTLSWDAYAMSWTIAADEVVLDTEPFELTHEGAFALMDDPSGDEATINVFLGDVVDEESDGAGGAGDDEDGVSQPGPALPLLAIALLVIALRRR